jgi:glucan 1,3-beta-glucosidase
MVGVNAGGWMVLEPWITPSLFYRFLDKTKGHVGVDSYTFCEALGPEEGNKVMRAHWDAWYTDALIKDLKDREIEVIRLPIGDWTLNQYGPYVGCMDGAAEKITWFLDTCAKYDIKVLMDVHAMKDSQNGYDNSGKASDVIWTSETEFSHWPNQAARWFGDWNHTTNQYDDINYAAQEWGLQVHEGLLKKWGKHPAFYAFEPLNEPQFNPITEVLKKWYKKSRELVRQHTNDAWFVFHNAQLDFNPEVWNGLFDPKDDRVAVDVHYYQAFIKSTDKKSFTDVAGACDNYSKYIAEIADGLDYPVWIGEWALATDVCAHWLGGFNDANTVA